MVGCEPSQQMLMQDLSLYIISLSEEEISYFWKEAGGLIKCELLNLCNDCRQSEIEGATRE